MKDRETTFEAKERRERLYAALDRSYNTIRQTEEVTRAARGLLDEARRILKETRWTGARRGSGVANR